MALAKYQRVFIIWLAEVLGLQAAVSVLPTKVLGITLVK